MKKIILIQTDVLLTSDKNIEVCFFVHYDYILRVSIGFYEFPHVKLPFWCFISIPDVLSLRTLLFTGLGEHLLSLIKQLLLPQTVFLTRAFSSFNMCDLTVARFLLRRPAEQRAGDPDFGQRGAGWGGTSRHPRSTPASCSTRYPEWQACHRCRFHGNQLHQCVW